MTGPGRGGFGADLGTGPNLHADATASNARPARVTSRLILLVHETPPSVSQGAAIRQGCGRTHCHTRRERAQQRGPRSRSEGTRPKETEGTRRGRIIQRHPHQNGIDGRALRAGCDCRRRRCGARAPTADARRRATRSTPLSKARTPGDFGRPLPIADGRAQRGDPRQSGSQTRSNDSPQLLETRDQAAPKTGSRAGPPTNRIARKSGIARRESRLRSS